MQLKKSKKLTKKLLKKLLQVFFEKYIIKKSQKMRDIGIKKLFKGLYL